MFKRSSALITLGAFFMLAATVAALDLGYWDGLRGFSGKWPAGVIERTDRLADWGDRLVNGLSVDAPTSTLMTELRKKLAVQNLGSIYETLPVGLGPVRSIVGYGAPTRTGRGYAFTLFNTREYPGDLDAPFGNWRGTLQLERTVSAEFKNRTLYRMEFLGDLSLGDFKYGEVLGFWEGFFKTAERVARGPDVSVEQKKAIVAQHPLLEDSTDLKLWQAFAQDMPSMSRFFNRFTLVSRLATPRHHPVVGDYLVVDFQWKVRLSTFQKEFPGLAERFKKIGRVVDLQGVLRNSEGQRVLKYRLKTDPRTVRFQALLKDGKFLPFDLEDEPIEGARPFQLSGLRSEDMTFSASVRIEASGVKIDIDNLRFNVHVERGLASGGIVARLSGLDRLDVNGRVLGFIPMSFVNAVLSIEESTRDSLDAAVRGFGGRGATLGMEFDNPVNGKPSHWKLSSSSITIENKFMQFVLSIGGSRFVMSENEQVEMGKVLNEAYQSLNSDYRDLRKRVGVLN